MLLDSMSPRRLDCGGQYRAVILIWFDLFMSTSLFQSIYQWCYDAPCTFFAEYRQGGSA